MENLQQEKVQKIQDFMKNWFENFDRLEENSYFLQYLSDDVKMKFPGNDQFTGHDAFCNWFTDSKNNMLGNTTHHVSDIKITEVAEDQYDIKFKVRYVAPMKQANIDMDVTEDWRLSWDNVNDKPIISEYLVS